MAALLPCAALHAGVPGSATTPPKVQKSPTPPPPADGRPSGLLLLVWINADGTVAEAEHVRGNGEWYPVVAESLKQWVFEPVMADGKPVPARTEVEFTHNGSGVSFSMSPLPCLPGELHAEKELGLVPPALVYDPDVILPLEGRLMKATPRTVINFVVEDDGSTGRFQVAETHSEQATRAALDVVSVQRFQPATIREMPVAVEYTRSVAFVGGAEKIAGLEGAAAVTDPAYPYERLLAGESGRAKVRFKLGPAGDVTDTAVMEATHPDFGAALVAAVETWWFVAEAAAEKPEREFEFQFELARVPYGARRLAEFVRGGGQVSNKATGLDARPKALARPDIVYPRSLLSTRPDGSAKIEFVIDRSGLAQMPRVVEASAPEFGWAAATCVNGMRFAPISRGGRPAELRVVLPFHFKPPVEPTPAATEPSSTPPTN
ncbi:MAG: TonB family protein [Opitutaceae bacterium]